MYSSIDERISAYIDVTEKLAADNFDVNLEVQEADPIGILGQALSKLSKRVEARYIELKQLSVVTESINSGLLIENVMNTLFDSLNDLLPYDRLSLCMLEEENTIARAYWTHSKAARLELKSGYSAKLSGSSLEELLTKDKVRIINDLPEYLARKPTSGSTRLIVKEGMRSSLTCPLKANGIPIGFMFFSSMQANTYRDAHVEVFQRIANQVSCILEKSRLLASLLEQRATLTQQNKELEALNEEKNYFLGMAAHDLRGPIAQVRGIADLLMEGVVRDQKGRLELLEMQQRVATYMLNLLDSLLDVSKIDSGKLDLKRSSFELSALLTEVVHDLSWQAAAKGSMVVKGDVPALTVKADALRIRQVLDNFISNALKFSPANSTIVVGAFEREGIVTVYCDDQGPGIPDQERHKLFKEFSRLKHAPTAGEKSTGLGLAIARRIIVAHGGEIGADNRQEGGARFWFTL